MDERTTLSASQWAEVTFGSAYLGDQRRTKRVVQIARGMAQQPDASLPKQMGKQAATKAAYRLMECPDVRYENLIRGHLDLTRAQIIEKPQVLLIQDMTEVDYHHHPKTSGLGPVGYANRHQGFLLQTVMAVDPRDRSVYGIAAQEPFLREPAPQGETSFQREKREKREPQVWDRQVRAIGPPPAGSQWIHVGDRGSDIFAFMEECLKQGADFLVRAKHDRRVDLFVEQGDAPLPPGARRRGGKDKPNYKPVRHLHEVVDSWPAMQHSSVHIDGNQMRTTRDAQVLMSWGSLRLWEPDGEQGKGKHPMVVWVVHVWEPDPPAGIKAIEWILLTSVAVHNEQDANERVEWYRMRWMIEDYHQGIKTGCGMEQRQLQSYEGLRRLLGILAPLAVRMLQLRAMARNQPGSLASEIMTPEVVAVVASMAHVEPQALTTLQCWNTIAQRGGYLGRKSDGPPGWKTLWRGWYDIQLMIEGILLVAHLRLGEP